MSPTERSYYRPRATTEGGSSRPRPQRHATMDESSTSNTQRRHREMNWLKSQLSGDSGDSRLGTSADSASISSGGGQAGEGEKDELRADGKRLPTIFKYQGTGKDVYVCGKFQQEQCRSASLDVDSDK